MCTAVTGEIIVLDVAVSGGACLDWVVWTHCSVARTWRLGGGHRTGLVVRERTDGWIKGNVCVTVEGKINLSGRGSERGGEGGRERERETHTGGRQRGQEGRRKRNRWVIDEESGRWTVFAHA